MRREFAQSGAGLKTKRANQTDIQTNTAKLCIAFLDPILDLGRKMRDQEKVPPFTTQLKNIKGCWRITLPMA